MRSALFAVLVLVGCEGNIVMPSGAPVAPPLGRAAPPQTDTPDDPGPCVDGVIPARRVWPLERTEFDATVAAVLGDTSKPAQTSFPVGNRVNGYASNPEGVVVDGALALSMLNVAETLAATAAAHESLGCTAGAGNADPCITSYLTRRAKDFFRRPPTQGEVTDLYQQYQLGAQNAYDGTDAQTSGIELAMTALLMSPQFFYRTELGDPADTSSSIVTLTPYEIASALSYLAVGGPPDETLLALADSGALGTPDVWSAQFARLLATGAGHTHFDAFVLQWVGADEVVSLPVTVGAVPSDVAQSMVTEAQRLVDSVAFSGTGTLDELLTSTAPFLDDTLTQFYGDLGQRPGLLSRGAFLAQAAAGGIPLLHRGKTVRQSVLCEVLPSFADLGMPGFTPPSLAAPQPGETTREELEHTITPGSSCATCHNFFMPIGFGFENFDSAGRWRTTENGGQVDPSGDLVAPHHLDPATNKILEAQFFTSNPFADFPSLITSLAGNPAVGACFVQQAMTYASGRTSIAANECALRNAQSGFSGNLTAGLASYVGSDAFAKRTR